MNNYLIIGLDLSFSCTGISIGNFENDTCKKLSFHKLMFDDCNNKTGKRYTPEQIKNVSIETYTLPTNLLMSDLCFDLNDNNNVEQTTVTLKAIVCAKRISNILIKYIDSYKPEIVYVAIENYIMPAFEGQNQLKTVSGLITLQGYVRRNCIEICLNKKIQIKLFTPTASENKLFFTGNGRAEKIDMLKTFLSEYDGNKLLPTIDLNSVHKINDVIDAFSLMTNNYSKIIKTK
jgi:hypothetical protein